MCHAFNQISRYLDIYLSFQPIRGCLSMPSIISLFIIYYHIYLTLDSDQLEKDIWLLLKPINDLVISVARLVLLNNELYFEQLPHDTFCWSVGRLVGPSICHNFLKVRKVTLQCSYRSTCLYLEVLNTEVTLSRFELREAKV